MRALVTGASRGIGAALVTEGRSRGHEVLGATRGVGRIPGDIVFDVTDPAAQAAAARAVGPIDLLVCNASVYADKGRGLPDLTVEDLNATFAANVTGVFLTVQAQRANMSAGGRIAIIASRMGSSHSASGNPFAYRASKAAAINLGLNLAQALHADAIAVGIYHPGWVRTDMGGASADISVEAAAQGLWDRFTALDMGRTGCFEAYDGETIPI